MDFFIAKWYDEATKSREAQLMSLGENIYRLRTKKNMSQGDLADAMEISRQSVSKWENNSATPDLEKLIKMSELFEVTLDELVGRTAPSKETTPIPPSESTPALTSADLVSVLILFFAILIPIVIISLNLNSMFLLILALFVIPPASTICAALCTPKNKILFRVFLVYDVIMGLLSAIAAAVFAPLVIVGYVFAVGFWDDRLE